MWHEALPWLTGGRCFPHEQAVPAEGFFGLRVSGRGLWVALYTGRKKAWFLGYHLGTTKSAIFRRMPNSPAGSLMGAMGSTCGAQLMGAVRFQMSSEATGIPELDTFFYPAWC